MKKRVTASSIPLGYSILWMSSSRVSTREKLARTNVIMSIDRQLLAKIDSLSQNYLLLFYGVADKALFSVPVYLGFS